MSYFCRSDRLTNKAGDGLEGYKVRALDKTSGAVISIYSDENGTALADNTAVVDALGNYSYFIAHGVYQEEYLTPDGVRSFVRLRVNMAGDPDAVTDSQAARDAAAASASTASTAATTASTAATTATEARDEAESLLAAATEAIGADYIFLTNADAVADLAGVPEGKWVRVEQDETQDGIAWLYRKISGVLVSQQPANPSAIVSGESINDDVDRVMRTSVARASTAKVVWIMDDGYRTNFEIMFPILRKRGQVANIAVEIDRIGKPYTVADIAPTSLGTIAHPTCTADDYRKLLKAGWQLLNHMAAPDPGTVASHVASYRAENRLLQQVLTGAKRSSTTAIGVFVDGAAEWPEWDDYRVMGGVYRGGVNDQTTDNACRYVFDTGVRDVPSATDDHPYVVSNDGPRPVMASGYVIDTSNRPLKDILSFIDGIAATGSKAIIYGHHTPVDAQATTSPPSCKQSDLEAISRRLYERGVQTCTWSQAFPGNLVSDPRHEMQHSSFTAASGDTAGYDSGTTYFGEARNARLVYTANRTTVAQTGVTLATLAVEPFRRYRVRIGYVIPTDLTLSGGSANRNHGLAVQMVTSQGSGSGYSSGSSDDWTLNGAFISPGAVSDTSASSVAIGRGDKTFTVSASKEFFVGQMLTFLDTASPNVNWMRGTVKSYNSTTGVIVMRITDNSPTTGTISAWTVEAYRRPFRATNGEVQFWEATLCSMNGHLAVMQIGAINATGEVRIVHISLEDMGDYSRTGLTFNSVFNTTVARLITLPAPSGAIPRSFRWMGQVTAPYAAPTYTVVNYAEEDSTAIAAPTTGQTAYVLGLGLNAFANQGGMIATWNGSAWTFASPSVRTYIQVTGTSQGIGGGRRWFHRFRSTAAGAINDELWSAEPIRDAHVAISGSSARVSCWSGGRTDAFALHVFPVPDNMNWA